MPQNHFSSWLTCWQSQQVGQGPKWLCKFSRFPRLGGQRRLLVNTFNLLGTPKVFREVHSTMLQLPVSEDVISPLMQLHREVVVEKVGKYHRRAPAEAALRSRRRGKVAMGVLIKAFTLWLVLHGRAGCRAASQAAPA